jgi:hypothetical protein
MDYALYSQCPVNGFWIKGNNKSCYFEAELIHNLPVSMLEFEIIEHDIHFLNNQAKWYLEKCNSKISPLYERNERLIKELVSIVPEERKHQLKWGKEQ